MKPDRLSEWPRLANGIPALIVALASLGAYALVGCQPGSLPCDKDEDWKRICAGGADAAAGSIGTGTGGAGQGGAGGSPGTGGMMPAAVNADTPIADCEQYKTLGGMDQFFKTRCANADACHQVPLLGDYKTPDVWKRATNKTVGACMGTPFADPGGDLTKSVMWVKTQTTPVCPDGKSAGVRMPNPPAEPLNATEMKCLEGFIKALKTP